MEVFNCCRHTANICNARKNYKAKYCYCNHFPKPREWGYYEYEKLIFLVLNLDLYCSWKVTSQHILTIFKPLNYILISLSNLICQWYFVFANIDIHLSYLILEYVFKIETGTYYHPNISKVKVLDFHTLLCKYVTDMMIECMSQFNKIYYIWVFFIL